MSHMTLNLTCYVVKSLGRAAGEVTIDSLALAVRAISRRSEIRRSALKGREWYFANTRAFENTEAFIFF